MRIFIAVTLDGVARAQVAALVDELRRQPALAAQPVRWVPEANLHLTLRFLGEVDERRAASVRKALMSAWTRSAFKASLGAAGLFPPRGAPRVIWLDVGDGADGLRALRQELEGRLAAIGYARERKPFHPHLTIGRVRREARDVGRSLQRAVAGINVPPIRWTIDHLVLMESRLSSEGAAYHELAAATLGSAGSARFAQRMLNRH